MLVRRSFHVFSFFFFNDTATTEIYTLSLHDALPISRASAGRRRSGGEAVLTPGGDQSFPRGCARRRPGPRDRKSTRLNSSHLVISYAVFCLKKKKRALVGLETVCCPDTGRELELLPH